MDVNKLVSIPFDSCPAMKLCQRLLLHSVENFIKLDNHNCFEENIKDYEDIYLGNKNILMLSCSSHLLQLVIKHSLTKNEDLNCFIKNMVEVAKYSTKKYTDKPTLTFNLPFEVRWNTYFMFLKSIQEKFDLICDMSQEMPTHLKTYIDIHSFNKLVKLNKLLEPFYILTKKCEYEDHL